MTQANTQATVYWVNNKGLQEIAEFLKQNHKSYVDFDDFPKGVLEAWAKDVEFQTGEGNRPTIEIESRYSIHGFTQELEISKSGLNAEVIEFDE